MGLPTVIDFLPENDFGGTVAQQSSRFYTFLSHVLPDSTDGIDYAVDALYAHDSNFQRGAVHPYDSSLFVDSFDVALAAKGINRDGHYLFRVHVAYATGQIVTPQENDEKVLAVNPLEDPPAWRSSFRTEMVVADKDINGKAIVNKAGDYYDPPPMRKKVIWTHACTVNVASVPTALTGYANAVNSESCSVRGIACGAETVQIVGIDIPDVQTLNDVSFVPLTLVYEVDPDGFDLKVLNQGYRGLSLLDGEAHDIYITPSQEDINDAVDNGWPTPAPQRASVPCMLTTDGYYIPDPTPETCVFNPHEVTNKISFTGLPGIT